MTGKKVITYELQLVYKCFGKATKSETILLRSAL